MARRIDHTHDPALASWVPGANEPGTYFPVQNLPFGAFRTGSAPSRLGVAIGNQVLDLNALADAGLLAEMADALVEACRAPDLGTLMGLGRASSRQLRWRLSELLTRTPDRSAVEACLVPMDQVVLGLPADVGDYTDFYASLFHATNVGRLFRPESPLLPNYKWIPVGYHGRASSVIVSGDPVRRPRGQARSPGTDAPVFGPSRMLDYEVELGAFIGQGNALGAPVPVADAEDHVFGVCLLNDWSARDLQAWEYQPLGPFLGKSFATSISPWVVTLEALAPFRSPAFERDVGDPKPLPYLTDGLDRDSSGLDVSVEAYLCTQDMADRDLEPIRLSRGSTRSLFWSLAQMVAHHTSNGCNLRAGDLIGTGTVSGDSSDSLGCLLEITRRGEESLTLPSGETRTFLEDGDEVTLRGYCARPGRRLIGLGECRARVLPAGP